MAFTDASEVDTETFLTVAQFPFIAQKCQV